MAGYCVAIGLFLLPGMLILFNAWRVPFRLLHNILIGLSVVIFLLMFSPLRDVWINDSPLSALLTVVLTAFVFVVIQYGKVIRMYLKYRETAEFEVDTSGYTEYRRLQQDKRKQNKRRRTRISGQTPETSTVRHGKYSSRPAQAPLTHKVINEKKTPQSKQKKTNSKPKKDDLSWIDRLEDYDAFLD